MKTLLITGETYKIRRQIRVLGGRWNGDHKGWIVPFEKREQAEAVKSGQPRTLNPEKVEHPIR